MRKHVAMAAQRLNARSTRRLGRITGLDNIIRGWGHGGYVHGFVTSDHRHGWADIRTGEWGYDEDPFHYTSCSEMFPGFSG